MGFDEKENQGAVRHATSRSFDGKIADIESVLGLRFETINKKKAYKDFIEDIAAYVSSNMKLGTYLVAFILAGEDPMDEYDKLTRPSRVEEEKKDDKDAIFEYQTEYKQYIDGKRILRENHRVLYGVIWGQCSPSLQAVIKGLPDFLLRSTKYDVEWLLKQLKVVSNGIDCKSNVYVQLQISISALINIRQYANESNDAYLRRFNSAVDTVELCGGNHIFFTENSGYSYDIATNSEKERIKDRFLAVCLIRRSDRSRYGNEQDILEKRDASGMDEYPTTLMLAFDTLNRWSLILNRRGPRNADINEKKSKPSFAGTDNVSQYKNEQVSSKSFMAGLTNDKKEITLKKHIKCKLCKKWGHWPDKCPKRFENYNGDNQMASLMQVQVGFAQKDSVIIPDNHIILDSASSASVFKNPALVSDIVDLPPREILQLITNGGSETFKQRGNCEVLPMEVYFNSSSLANILALSDVAALEDVTITMDTSLSNAICVHTPLGTLCFEKRENGLYSMDMNDINNGHNDNNNKMPITTYSFTSTVNSNKSIFTREQIQRAEKSRKIQQYIGWPSNADFCRYIKNGNIQNSRITIDDINRGTYIHGPPVPLLQGKTTRQTTLPLRTQQLIALPPPILLHHQNVHLTADLFYVNGMAFLHTKSQFINFLSVQALPSRSARVITRGLIDVIQKYDVRGFKVASLRADNEFDIAYLRDSIHPIPITNCARGEHVGIIERSIRTVKERARCYCHTLPYTRFTKIMVTSLLEHVIYWLNSFPSTNGVSQNLSPGTIVLGRSPPNLQYKHIPFGALAIVYTGTSNTMQRRGVRAIALREHNFHGSFWFMSLETGHRLHSSQWTELPIDDYAISRVHELAMAQNQPLLHNQSPLFEWEPGVPIIDPVDEPPLQHIIDPPPAAHNEGANHDPIGPDDEDEGIINQNEGAPIGQEEPYYNDAESVDNIPVENNVPQVDLDDVENIGEEQPQLDDTESIGETQDNQDDITIDTHNHEHAEVVHTANDYPEENIDDLSENEGTEDEGNPQNQITDDTVPENQAVSETREHRKRPTRANAGTGVDRLNIGSFKGKTYKARALQFVMEKEHAKNVLIEKLTSRGYSKITNGVMFTQMNANKGIKMFGERAIAAMIKEFKQLDAGPMDRKPVVCPMDPKSLSLEQKLKALDAVNLIQEKRDGRVKGRTCANGSKQHKFLKENESIASPTISLEAIIATLIIDAKEERDVAIFDVPGAYLHAKMPEDKNVILKLRGQFVDIMCNVNPEYKRTIMYENGKKVLYLKVLRAIYGCIYSSLLWYNLYSETLVKMGFKINPYDRCIANKTINGKQCTIGWYVDDNKVSHEDEKVVTKMLNTIKQHFGDLKISRGKVHDFLGMKIEFLGNQRVSIDMSDQVQEAIEMFSEEIHSFATTPAGRNLFNVNEEVELLNTKDTERFHSVTAKLLFIAKRSRPNIETAVAFLTTRVSKSNVEDMEKLRRLIKYLAGTKNDKRIIGGENLLQLHSWIDASYAVHPNMRSHTGGCMSFGTGIIHGKSSKQKLNAKSSTEAEIVGLSEYLPYNLWMKNFMKEQGYKLRINNIYQDNQSAIRMEINGRNSCTGNSRHIDIRYFFVKDRVDKEEVTISYCPTEIMLADFFTKPLQGSLFKKFKEVIMGHVEINKLKTMILPNKERVEDSIFELNHAKDSEQNEVSSDFKDNRTVSYLEVAKGKRSKNKTKTVNWDNDVFNHSLSLNNPDRIGFYNN